MFSELVQIRSDLGGWPRVVIVSGCDAYIQGQRDDCLLLTPVAKKTLLEDDAFDDKELHLNIDAYVV